MKFSAATFKAALGVDFLFCGWITWSFAGQAPLLREFVLSSGSWWLWRSDTVWRLRPLLCVIAILLAISGWLLGWRAARQDPCGRLRSLCPVALLPLLIPACLYQDLLPPAWLANLVFYVPLLLLSLSLAAWLSYPLARFGSARLRLNPAWIICLGASIFFFITGLHYTRCCGPHAGDEGHYLIQATSLYQDGDLDIRNNLENVMGTEEAQRLDKDNLHVSPLSRAPHWYSYHAPGLAFLLAPVVPGGDVARHGVLGIIAGLACAAMWLLCRRSGASLIACGVVLLAFGLSIYWTVYSSRALPEVLGAGLVTWLCWSVLAQADYPWRTALLAGFCCAYLPWAQIRFYPLALAGLAYYSANGLCTAESFARRWLRLGVFLMIGLGGIAVYRHFQDQMFDGGFSHAVGDLMLSYPPGLWRVFTNPAGLLNTFPLAFWMATAGLAWIVVGAGRRRMAITLAGMFGLAWICACAVPNYFGGSTLGGRFLVVVMPLLLPATAALWDRATPAALWWFFFLALISVALCGLELLYLPELGRSFAFPFFELPVVVTVLRGWQYPVCGPLHALVLLLLTLLLVTLRNARLAAGLAAAMLIVSVTWHIVGSLSAPASPAAREPDDPGEVADYLAGLDLQQIRVSPPFFARKSDGLRRGAALAPGQGLALFDISDHLWQEGRSNVAPSVTTHDLGIRLQGQTVSQPRLEINDWHERAYRWTTLVEPFDPGRGQRAFYMEGQIEGPVTAILTIREGATTIMEEPLTPDAQGIVRLKIAVFTEGGRGHLYLLLRLEGAGSFHTRRLHWSPVSQRLLDQAGLAW